MELYSISVKDLYFITVKGFVFYHNVQFIHNTIKGFVFYYGIKKGLVFYHNKGICIIYSKIYTITVKGFAFLKVNIFLFYCSKGIFILSK